MPSPVKTKGAWVWVWVYLCVAGTEGTIRVSGGSSFCSLAAPLLRCVFANTTEDVEIGKVEAGVREVRLEAALVLHAFPECHLNLHVMSSSNVTLQGGGSPKATSTSTPSGNNNSSATPSYRTTSAATPPSSIFFPPSRHIIFPDTSLNYGKEQPDSRGGSGVADSSNSATGGLVEKGQCGRNITVTQSKVLWVRGKFEKADLQLSQVQEVSGEIGRLDVRRSSITRLDIMAKQVKLEDSKIWAIHRLEIEEEMLWKNVELNRIARTGLTISGQSEEHSFAISKARMGVLEGGAVRVAGVHVALNDISVGVMNEGALRVEHGGTLILTNVAAQHGSHSSLVLGPDATLILDHFTLDKETIIHLELSTTGANTTILPLLALKPQQSVEAASQPIFKGFPWYWLIIMTAVGLIAGLVLGTAAMWRPNLAKALPLISLGDLLGKERAQEENEGYINETPHSQCLSRQDSGLTSSSFASYTPGRERLSSLKPSSDQQPSCQQSDVPASFLQSDLPPSNRLSHLLPSCQNSGLSSCRQSIISPSCRPSDPLPPVPTTGNIYEVIHPPAIQQEIIYEDADALMGPKTDSTYMEMK